MPEIHGEAVRALALFLSDEKPEELCVWRGWQIQRVGGGWNNLLYRATNGEADLAIKFSIRDERDRAGREYDALATLRELGLDIAPRPILLDRTAYNMPVVVYAWLDGPVYTEPPANDADWDKLLDHLVAVHSVTPDLARRSLRPAVLTAYSADEVKCLVDDHLTRIPVDERPAELRALVAACHRKNFPGWSRPAPTLCRVDSAIQNFIQRQQDWASVDWENAGWGDPAYEIADLVTHAAHIRLPAWRRRWIADRYAELVGQPAIAGHIMAYHQILVVWWAVRTYRYLYEIPRGLDPRLATMPGNWYDDITTKHERYLALADVLYSRPDNRTLSRMA